MRSKTLQEFYTRLAGYLTTQKLHEMYDEEIGPDAIDQIISSDPTYQEGSEQIGSYTPWIIKQFKDQSLQLEDLGILRDYLVLFNRIKPKLEVRDIYQYPDFTSLYETILPYINTVSQSDKEKSIKEQVDILYEDDVWLFIRPNTYEAGCYYGAGTRWCTTSSNNSSLFESYNSRAYLYIIINKKTNNKFQFDANSKVFLDESDTPGFEKFLQLHPPKELLDWIYFTDPKFFENYIDKIRKEEILDPIAHQMSFSTLEEKKLVYQHFSEILNQYLSTTNLGIYTIIPESTYTATAEINVKSVNSEDSILRAILSGILRHKQYSLTSIESDIASLAEETFETFIIASSKIIKRLSQLGIEEEEDTWNFYSKSLKKLFSKYAMLSHLDASFQSLEAAKVLTDIDIDAAIQSAIEQYDRDLLEQERRNKRDERAFKKHENLKSIIVQNIENYTLDELNEKIIELNNSRTSKRFDWASILIPKLYLMLPDTITPAILRRKQREDIEFNDLLSRISDNLNIKRFTRLLGNLVGFGLVTQESDYTFTKN